MAAPIPIPSGATIEPPKAVPIPTDATVDAPETTGQHLKRIGKTLGRNTAVTAAGASPMMAGAELGAEAGTAIEPGIGTAIGGVAGGAIGALAAPAAQYFTERAMGEKPAAPTLKDAGKSAVSAAEWGMAIPAVEQTLIGNPLHLVERALGISGASELADKGRAGAAEEGSKLQEQQTQIRTEESAKRTAAGQSALKEHATAISDAEAVADKARAKLRESTAKDVEKARPAAAEAVANSQAQSMVGKTPAQFAQEAAQPYGQRAQALSRAADPVFDASAKFHEEVGAKFAPYVDKVKNDVVAPHIKTAIDQSVAGTLDTIAQRGQRIESSDLNKVIKDLQHGSEPEGGDGSLPDDTQVMGGTLGDIKDPTKRKMTEKMLLDAGYKPPKSESALPQQLTNGQLWGYRARANRVLASSKNPADRWAAREVISTINDAIPGIPQEIRSQYAFERKVAGSILGQVSKARTPQEVGEAIFGSKASPEPAEVPLQVIRFTKQYAPDQMDGLREAFADRYVGNRMDANDLAKMNRNVLTELYGNKADSVLRLVGPEGDAKMASWGQLIKSDPQARTMLESSIRDSITKQANLTQREALQAGEKALNELPPKYDFIRQKMAAVKTPQEKLDILKKEMPDIEAAAKEAMQSGAAGGKLTGRFEGYMHRRMMFMGLMMGMGGYGMLAKRPGLVTAALVMAGGLGVRAGARYAISTETGADAYMKALDMRPTPANAAAFGRVVTPIIAAGLLRPSTDSTSAPTPSSGSAPPPHGSTPAS